MRAWGDTTQRMLDALETLGPMTRSEICAALDLNRDEASSIVTRLRRPRLRPEAPARVYISAWRDDEEGQRRYLRAVYALGCKPDAPKPRYRERQLAAKRRYWQRRKVKLGRAVNSVFALAGATS
jgi:hypothetical protein